LRDDEYADANQRLACKPPNPGLAAQGEENKLRTSLPFKGILVPPIEKHSTLNTQNYPERDAIALVQMLLSAFKGDAAPLHLIAIKICIILHVSL
jgi:hypothetical protein